jgi:hypothetical protein
LATEFTDELLTIELLDELFATELIDELLASELLDELFATELTDALLASELLDELTVDELDSVWLTTLDKLLLAALVARLVDRELSLLLRESLLRDKLA